MQRAGSKVEKRQIEQFNSLIFISTSQVAVRVAEGLAEGIAVGVSQLTGNAIAAATSTSWVKTTAATIDFLEAGSFVTSATSLIRDLISIFFNTLEIFA